MDAQLPKLEVKNIGVEAKSSNHRPFSIALWVLLSFISMDWWSRHCTVCVLDGTTDYRSGLRFDLFSDDGIKEIFNVNYLGDLMKWKERKAIELIWNVLIIRSAETDLKSRPNPFLLDADIMGTHASSVRVLTYNPNEIDVEIVKGRAMSRKIGITLLVLSKQYTRLVFLPWLHRIESDVLVDLVQIERWMLVKPDWPVRKHVPEILEIRESIEIVDHGWN